MPLTARLVGSIARRTPSSPIIVALLVTALYAVFVLFRLRATGSDPSFFLIASPPFTDPAEIPEQLDMFPPDTGYDGQFFYRLALDPWSTEPKVDGITFDSPAYRQQRIMYPLVARILTFGDWQHTPRALVGANILAVGALAYAAAAFAVTVGRNVFIGVVAPLYPGYLATISRDEAELTEAALLAAGIVLVLRRHYWLAGIALTASMLAKETAALVPIAGILVWTISRMRRKKECGPPLAVWLAPLAAFGLWYELVAFHWGMGAFDRGFVTFGPPFVGIAQGVQLLSQFTVDWRTDISIVGLVTFTTVAVVVSYRRRVFHPTVLSLACVMYAAAAPFYGHLIWEDEYSFPRALHEAFLTGALALMAVNTWVTRLLTLATIVFWWGWAANRFPYP